VKHMYQYSTDSLIPLLQQRFLMPSSNLRNRLQWVTKSLAFALLLLVKAADAQSPFFKEILLGRCYEKPTTGNINQCPQVVGSIMNVLDSQLDASIDSLNSFAPYMRMGVDFSSPINSGLIWLTGNDGTFAGNTDTTNYSTYGGMNQQQQAGNFALHRNMAPIELLTPEQTPGGFLLHDLVFCGVDRKNDGSCTKETSNAYRSFWAAAYAQFARSATGSLRIVIEPYSDLEFLRQSVIQQLNSYQVTEVILYVENCQEQEYTQLVDSIPIVTVQCKDQFSDYAFFLLCQNPSSDACSMLGEVDGTGTISTQQQAAIEQQVENETVMDDKNTHKKRGNFFVRFILFLIACTLVYRYMQKPNNPPRYHEYSDVPAADTTRLRL